MAVSHSLFGYLENSKGSYYEEESPTLHGSKQRDDSERMREYSGRAAETTVSKRGTAGCAAPAASSPDVQDPAGRRRVLNARYKLLLQLEAQAPRSATSQTQCEEEEEEEDFDEDFEEDDGGGECWLSRLLAGMLTFVVTGFICFVVARHRVLFE